MAHGEWLPVYILKHQLNRRNNDDKNYYQLKIFMFL